MKQKHLAYALIFVAVAVMLHQYLTWGTWWTWDQVLHHETLAVALSAFAIGMLAVVYWRRRK